MSTIKSQTEHLTLNADGTGKDIKLQANGSEKVIIKSDGSVGIGTSSPAVKTEIKGGAGEVLRLSNTSNSGRLHLYPSTGVIESHNSNFTVGTNDGFDLVLKTTATERMRIDSSGSLFVGATGNVGTSTPGFQVVDDYVKTSRDSSAARSHHQFYNPNGLVGSISSSGSGTLYNTGNGGGIDFSANANASGMTSELLDDYEEGTWTPGLTFGTIDSTNWGRYVKIGSQVTIWFQSYNLNVTSGQALEFKNLPFALTSSTQRFTGSCMTNHMDFPTGTTFITPYMSDSYGGVRLFYSKDSGSWSNLTSTHVPTTSDVYVTMTYQIFN